MRARAAWAKPFQFSEDQRIALYQILKRDDEKAKNLLGAIQVVVPDFLMNYEVIINQESETPRQARTLLKRIARNAKQLSCDLEELDSLGSAAAFDYGCFRLGRPIESLNYLPSELLLVAAAATGGAEYIGPAKRGRRESTPELQFIARVGYLYHHHLDRIPRTSRGAQFTKFMSKIFFFVDPKNPRSYSDISKFTKKALSNFKPDNG